MSLAPARSVCRGSARRATLNADRGRRPEELAAINAKIDAQGLEPVHDRMAGRFGHNPGAAADPGLLAWGPEFTSLLDHPRILPYLKFTMDETVVGSHPPVAASLGDRARQLTDVPFLTDVRSTMLTGVRLDRLYGIEMTKTIGVGGSFGVHQDHEGTYQFRQGSMRNSLVVVAWNLTDSGGDNGGVRAWPCPVPLCLFLTARAVCCVRQFFVFPGSHKANWPLPASAAAALSAEQLRLPAGAQVPRAPAGSCTIFSEALVHGTWPWTADHDRRCMLYKYSQKHITQGPNAVPPSNVELSPAQRRLFQPPHARGLRDAFHPGLDEDVLEEMEGRMQEMQRRRRAEMAAAAAAGGGVRS